MVNRGMERRPADARLTRLRELYPGAIERGVARGTRYRLPAEVRRMERRGEIIALHRFTRMDARTGQMMIPYVRMKARRQVTARRAVLIGAGLACGVLVLTGVGWLLWQSRRELLAGALLLGLVTGSVWLAPHWGRGCSGLHCSGCRG